MYYLWEKFVVILFAPCEESGGPMVPVELSKSFLDISVEFLGGVLARFADISVIKKGHQLALVHDYQGYSLVCCEDHVRGVFPEGFDGLPLCLGGVVSGSSAVFVPLQDVFVLC